MPSEVFAMADAYVEREKSRDRTIWEAVRQLGAWLFETAGMKDFGPVKPKQLIQFADEIEEAKKKAKRLTPAQRQRQAEKTWMLHKKKAWMLLKLDEKTGKVKVMDEEKLEELRKRYKK